MSQPPQGPPPPGQGGPPPGWQPGQGGGWQQPGAGGWGHQPGQGSGWPPPQPGQPQPGQPQPGQPQPGQAPPAQPQHGQPPPDRSGPYGPPTQVGGWPQQPPRYGEQPTQVGGFAPAGPQQPPWGPPGAPGGPGWPPAGPTGGGPRNRGLLIAGISGLVLLAVVAVVLAFTLTGGDDDATASAPTPVGSPASPSRSTAPAPLPPPAAPSPAPPGAADLEAFLATLPTDFVDCAEAPLADDGDLLAASCGPSVTQPGPTSAQFFLYPDVETLDAVFTRDAESGDLTEFPEGEDCSTSTGFGGWGVDGEAGGMVGCVIRGDGTISIVWTDDEFLTEGLVSAPGSTQADVTELYAWWTENSFYVG